MHDDTVILDLVEQAVSDIKRKLKSFFEMTILLFVFSFFLAKCELNINLLILKSAELLELKSFLKIHRYYFKIKYSHFFSLNDLTGKKDYFFVKFPDYLFFRVINNQSGQLKITFYQSKFEKNNKNVRLVHLKVLFR